MYEYIKKLRWAKLKVGIVITIALFILFFTVIFAGNIERLFSPKVKIYALFDDVKGLREGSPVWFSGVEIGSVTAIKFTGQQKIQVVLSITYDTLKYLKKNSAANILTLGLLGDKYVEISPGSKEAGGLKAGDTIIGSTQTEFQDIVQTSKESIAKLSDFINMLQDIIVKIDKGEGTVSKFLKDPHVYNNLKEMTEDIKLFAQTLRTSEGTLNKLIKDPAVYKRFQSASENLDNFTQKLATSKGTLNRLIEDESLYKNMSAAAERLNKLLVEIDKGEGVMGSLVKDKEMSEELKATLKELNALVKDIKEHPRKYFKFSVF